MGRRRVRIDGGLARSARKRGAARLHSSRKASRGHVRACVAELSKHILDNGHRAILYTDLGNPTSNSIYRRIGHVMVAEAFRYRFEYSMEATRNCVVGVVPILLVEGNLTARLSLLIGSDHYPTWLDIGDLRGTTEFKQFIGRLPRVARGRYPDHAVPAEGLIPIL
jgi:hypothetical protein